MGKDDKKKKSDRPLPEVPQGNAVPAEQFDMVFHCQLAHGSPTRQVRDFTNVKQLYESIAKAFGVPTADVCAALPPQAVPHTCRRFSTAH